MIFVNWAASDIFFIENNLMRAKNTVIFFKLVEKVIMGLIIAFRILCSFIDQKQSNEFKKPDCYLHKFGAKIWLWGRFLQERQVSSQSNIYHFYRKCTNQHFWPIWAVFVKSQVLEPLLDSQTFIFLNSLMSGRASMVNVLFLLKKPGRSFLFLGKIFGANLPSPSSLKTPLFDANRLKKNVY